MTALKNKPQYNTLAVKKDDGTTVQVGRVALKDLDTLLNLQEKLIRAYVDVNGAIGQIMADEDITSVLASICSLIPVVEKKGGEVVYLDYTEISENWEQLIVLFFNGGLNLDTRAADDVLPSQISQLHFFPYMDLINKEIERVKEEKSKRK